jgi:hypothetical protein
LNCDEFLQTSHSPEPEHSSFPSSKRLVGIFRPVVQPATRLLSVGIANGFHRSDIGTQFICHNYIWPTVPFHRFSEELKGCLAISALRDIGFQHLTFMIHCAPKVVRLAINSYEDFVQMPSPIGVGSKLLNTFLSDLGSEQRTKSVPPIPNRFMADIDPALMQQVLDIAKREWKSDVKHHRQADDLRGCFEIAKWARLDHNQTLRNSPDRLNQFSLTEPLAAFDYLTSD